jgi:methyltransferase-like protein/SAM-dependent methyltransferase
MVTGPNAYDEVPYDSLAFAQTHPDRLATMARMFGLHPPPIATARVLELGCASGGNLIPMAFNLPGGEFVGIDLSQRHVDTALSTIGALETRNIRITHGSILDIDESWGLFDYIICHGVFSWVEPQVQDAILRIAANNLVENGIAYISYNTYPGWHMRETVRHMMRYHAGRFEEPKEQIEQARALLDFLTTAAYAPGPYGQLLNQEVERLGKASDSYLYHEHLEQTNAPLYFHQFVERAEKAGLQYLAEADMSDMLSSSFPASVSETLERISPDILHLEQYMDFVWNRLFRQTLLCHRGCRPKRALTPSLLLGLMMSSPAVPETSPIDLAAGTTVGFKNGRQRAESALPATKAALMVLIERWPHAIDADELIALALERTTPFLSPASIEEIRNVLMLDLFKSAMYGMVSVHTQQPRCTNQASETPRGYRLAMQQAQSGSIVVNAHHQMIQLEPLALEVLKLLNGSRRRADMLDALVERQESGALALADQGKPITAPEMVRAILSDRLEKTLTTLARCAVLVE